jgi:4-hydroxybenzoate polyprenyltransferase
MAAYAFQMPREKLIPLLFGCVAAGTVLHSAFCVLNDICDRDIDGMVGTENLSPFSCA